MAAEDTPLIRSPAPVAAGTGAAEREPQSRHDPIPITDGAPRAPTCKPRTLWVAAGALIALSLSIGVLAGVHHRLATTPLEAQATASSDDVFCDAAKHDAGYVKLRNKKDDHFFYWYVESRTSPHTDPLVLWLTGGPGCSSVMAMLAENGPCRVQPDLSTARNPFSWTNRSNVVWLDQPTNVGFSYAGVTEDADVDESSVGANIYWFLQGFLDKHPELVGRELFVTGESYAGHTVPLAAHYIWQQNQRGEHRRVNLQGIAIGNGLTDPAVQMPLAPAMARNDYNVTLVNSSQLAAMERAAPACERRLRGCQASSAPPHACVDAFNFCREELLLPLLRAGRNAYDIRVPCDKGEDGADDCYDMSAIARFLDAPAVRAYLHVDDAHVARWQKCNDEVNGAILSTEGSAISYSPLVADLLGARVRVLVYAGDADVMANWVGNRAWTRVLEWDGASDFAAAGDRAFVCEDEDEPAGVVTSSSDGRLTFLRLFNAGHMAPMDQPRATLAMLERFTRGLAL